MSSVLTPWLPIYPCVHAIRCPFLYIFHSEKNLNLFATNGCNKMCVCVRLLEWLHWWHNFLCYLLEKRYVVFITSWHCSLGGNFLADTIRYLSWPALSRSWHLAASGMGLRVMSHQAGLLTTLHHIHICFPEQGGNMVTTMGWGFSDFRQLFCFPLLINKACMYHNHIPLMYIFDSPANECWVSYSFNQTLLSVQLRIFISIFYNAIVSLLVHVNNKLALVQTMAWCQIGAKPLYNPPVTIEWPGLGVHCTNYEDQWQIARLCHS